MFYSHEILTSRKYGVATVWLVATLGAKSTTKRVTRKAILNVDVKKACETIMEPEAPMALRLQSSLLYGVSRVYDQQCSYVLQDVQAAQNAIRALINTAHNNQLDISAGKVRPEQLMLMDDPAFLPENALPALDFDFSTLDIHNGDSQRSTQSMMSIRNRSGSVSSHAASVLGLNIPSSSGNGAYQLPMNDPFSDHSYGPKHLGGMGRDLDEEDVIFQDDMIFGFNEDGELRDIPEEEREALRAGNVRSGEHRASDSVASRRVRKEHEDGRAMPHFGGEDGFNMQFGDHDMGVLPDVEPFDPLHVMTGGLGGSDQPQRHASQDRVFSEEPSSISAQATQKTKAKAKKTVTVDKCLEINNSVMRLWQTEYLDRMAATNLLKINQKANAQAKKNAFHFVLGFGLNGVGEGIGSSKFVSPLAMFSGDTLLSLITSKPISATSPKLKKGTKRAAESLLSSPNKRIHESELGRGRGASSNNPFDDGADMMIMDEDLSHSVELGRDAPSALPDYPSSAMMPWNVSASLHSHQRNASGSLQGRAGVLGSQIGSVAGGRRPTSASPLIGRGSNLLGEMEQFSMLHEDDAPIMYGRDDDFGSQGLGFGATGESSSQGGAGFQSRNSQHSRDDFEIFGQAANVDTQTAGTSQWVREALDKESNNFFEYVRNTISEKTGVELADSYEEMDEREKCVTFEELFDVEGNSRIVAAQAFYHVLCLATKHRVWVEQDTMVPDDDVPEPWGEIRIGIIEAGA